MNEHLTHYKKVKITKDISLRYFYTFQDRKNLEGKWVLKSHSKKKYTVIDNNGLELLEMLHDFDLNKYEEIRGIIKNNIYNKLVIKSNGKIKIFSEKKEL